MVKFVQSIDGDYYNINFIRSFVVCNSHLGRCVKIFLTGTDEYIVKIDFFSDEEAQEWLDNFIEQLEF